MADARSSASTPQSQDFATTVDAVLSANGVIAERRDDATRVTNSGQTVQWVYFLDPEARRLFVTIGPTDEIGPDLRASAGLTRTDIDPDQTLYTWPAQPGATTVALVTTNHTLIIRSEGIKTSDQPRPPAELITLLTQLDTHE